MEKIQFKQNQSVFKVGELPDKMYLLVKGSIGIFLPTNETNTPNFIIQENELFGEMGVIENELRMATARCMKDSEIISITKDEFNLIKTKFKNLLEEQFKTAKEYKPKLEWYDGVWSRYKPEIGKDKRGITGVSMEKIKKIGEKITKIPNDFNVHPTIKKIFENKKKCFLPEKDLIGLLQNS